MLSHELLVENTQQRRGGIFSQKEHQQRQKSDTYLLGTLLSHELLVENTQQRRRCFFSQKEHQQRRKNHPQVLKIFEVNLKDRKYQFWERNPLSVDLYSRKVVLQKLDYIHANPLSGKWNLAHSPLDYWFSSYRFYETGIDDFGFLTHYLEDC